MDCVAYSAIICHGPYTHLMIIEVIGSYQVRMENTEGEAQEQIVEEGYTNEERQKDIKCGKHLFLCFFYFWIALFWLVGLLWNGNYDGIPEPPMAKVFGILVQAVLIVIIYDQGAKGFGKPGIDSWPRPLRFIFQEKLGKTLAWIFFLTFWFIGGAMSASGQ